LSDSSESSWSGCWEGTRPFMSGVGSIVLPATWLWLRGVSGRVRGMGPAPGIVLTTGETGLRLLLLPDESGGVTLRAARGLYVNGGGAGGFERGTPRIIPLSLRLCVTRAFHAST
jgi:hypothetical protein